MNTLKCSYCGGSLTFNKENDCYICDYCDNVLLINNTDDEKIKQLKERANKLFLACDFDGASFLYQSVISESPDDAEAYWFLTLCTYGIQYVEDPYSGKRVPTCHRTLYTSILNNEDYLNALECADIISQETYKTFAKKIDDIQKGILDIVSKEPPYDIFICYKETDEAGKKTKESDIAKDLYYKLNGEGYHVFYAPVTLQEKAGQEYEPFIFAALSSAKIMFAIGFSNEHFNAPWVKNEWSRFLIRKKQNSRLRLVVCFNSFLMDASELPGMLSNTQARDLANASTNDLVTETKKMLPLKNIPMSKTSNTSIGNSIDESAVSLCKRGYIYLDNGQYKDAEAYFNKCLDRKPEHSNAYWGLILSYNKCKNNDELAMLGKPINELNEYKNALKFASGSEEDQYIQISDKITDKINKTIEKLKKKRYEEVLETEVDKQIDNSKEILINAENTFEKLLTELDETETEITKCKIECGKMLQIHLDSIYEIKNSAQALISQVNDVSSYTDSERKKMSEKIEKIKKNISETEILAENTKKNESCFKKLNELSQKHQNIINSIEFEKSKLTNLIESFDKTDKKIKETGDKYSGIFSQVKNGNYTISNEILENK